MDYVEYTEHPKLRAPTMLLAFAGWPDAAEGASGALKYLARKLPAQRFASIDPEEFYVFTRTRPVSSYNEHDEREVSWPANDFYAYHNGEREQDFLIFVGVEPNLKWRAYSNAIADVAQEQGVVRTIVVGALLDAVPHTRPIRVTGGSNDPELLEMLGSTGVRARRYEGPTGISTAVSQVFASRDIRLGHLWGHCPHYVQASSYPKVSLALLEKLSRALDEKFDLEELRTTESSFEQQFTSALENDEKVQEYVQQLERRYDARAEQSELQEPMPTPEEMVTELEEFLKRRRSNGDDQESQSR